jgi:hypothetical protein
MVGPPHWSRHNLTVMDSFRYRQKAARKSASAASLGLTKTDKPSIRSSMRCRCPSSGRSARNTTAWRCVRMSAPLFRDAANKRILDTVVQVPYPMTIDSYLIDFKASARQEIGRQLFHRKPNRVRGPVESHISVRPTSRCASPSRKQLRRLIIVEGFGADRNTCFHCLAPASKSYCRLNRCRPKGSLGTPCRTALHVRPPQ